MRKEWILGNTIFIFFNVGTGIYTLMLQTFFQRHESFILVVVTEV